MFTALKESKILKHSKERSQVCLPNSRCSQRPAGAALTWGRPGSSPGPAGSCGQISDSTHSGSPPSPRALSTVLSLHLRLHSCPANRCMSTVFPDSVHISTLMCGTTWRGAPRCIQHRAWSTQPAGSRLITQGAQHSLGPAGWDGGLRREACEEEMYVYFRLPCHRAET